MILSGEKKEEYREIKPYWCSRLTGLPPNWKKHNIPDLISEVTHSEFIYFKSYNTIIFKNGYGKTAPTIIIECKLIHTGLAKPEWSDNWKGKVFIIEIGKILKTKNIKIKNTN